MAEVVVGCDFGWDLAAGGGCWETFCSLSEVDVENRRDVDGEARSRGLSELLMGWMFLLACNLSARMQDVQIVLEDMFRGCA